MGAHFLTPYTKEKRMCKSSRLGSKTKWQIHKHFMIKSFAQARQCRWLVQMEPTLGHGLVLNSLHSHHLELEKATTFLPIVYYGSLYGDYIEINFFLKTFFWNSWIMNLLILWGYDFFIWVPIENLPTITL